MLLFRTSAAVACALLAGCATYSSDGGFGAVADGVRQHRNVEVQWLRSAAERTDARSQIDGLLAQPLSAEDAVQIALLNNRALQAQFENLRISEARLVRSGRLPNPGFTYAHAQAGGRYDIEATLTVNIIALLSLPYVHDTEKRSFAETQQSLVLDVTALGDLTRRAYYDALAARDSRRYAEQVTDAAHAGALLGERMQAAGNWNDVETAHERSFALDADQMLTRARVAEIDATEALLRLLGLDAQPSALRLAEQLPALPDAADDLAAAEQLGLDSRIDLAAMRTRLDELARRLKLSKATRFVNVFDAGPSRIRDGTRADPYESGFEVRLEIPLFDGGSAQVRRAEAIYASAADRFAQAAVQARSEIRTAYARVRASYEIADRLRAEVLPLRAAISEQNLFRYNAGQISVFDLLADARSRIDAVDAYIRSVRDYWVAKSALDSSLIGNTAAAVSPAVATPTVTNSETRG